MWARTKMPLRASIALAMHSVLCFSVINPSLRMPLRHANTALGAFPRRNCSQSMDFAEDVLSPKPAYPYRFSSSANRRHAPSRVGTMLSVCNDTMLLAKELEVVRDRTLRLEAILEEVLFAITNSDDLALLERDAARSLILDYDMQYERPARLLRSTLLAIMRRRYIPLPPSAYFQNSSSK
tara:strand:+ start:33 stop:575 length:543 start_codon:yes stop_codon:yes gene_type:complete